MKKILIDLGHPAHIHYFKNTIAQLEEKGYKFIITARDKEVLFNLLDDYKIKYFSRGKGRKSLLGKFLYNLYADFYILILSLKYRPDIYMGFASMYSAQVAYLLGKPSITLDDTEHATLSRKMYTPFTTNILNTSCYKLKHSDKQIFFNSYTDLFYLHPNYFTPNKEVLKLYNINESIPFFIIRLVAWTASHDIGQKGLNIDITQRIIEKLDKVGTVFVSAESEITDDFLKPYQIDINPAHFHDLLAFSSLYIGEGSTTASECSVLGVSNILINSLELGYIKEQEEIYGLSYHLRNTDKILDLIDVLITKNFNKEFNSERRKKLLNDKIDPTKFLVDFIEKYPNTSDK